MEPTIDKQPEKAKKGCPITIVIILAILAIGGIGFGVFELFNKPETIITDCDCPDCEAQNEAEHEISEERIENTNIDSSKDYYIDHLDNWGIKVKVPIGTTGYAFDGHRLYLWGTTHYQGEQAPGAGIMEEDGENNKIKTPFLAKIFETHLDCIRENSTFIMKISENRELCYKESENLKNTYLNEDMESHIEPTLKSMREYYTNPDNYSFIEN